MDNLFLNYMHNRMRDAAHKSIIQEPGPVITISREVGCGALGFAEKLRDALNQVVYVRKWQVISKEILEHSAYELQTTAEQIERRFSSSDYSTFVHIVEAFASKQYHTDRKILKTVRKVILGFANEGYSIIVGQGSTHIAQHIKRSLHIKLLAPFEWRVENLAQRDNITNEQALRYILKEEEKRESLRNYFKEKEHNHQIFDMVLNVSKLSTENIIDLVLSTIDKKGITKETRSSFSYF